MNDARRISRNFLYLLVGGIAASSAEFAAEVIMARRLSDTGYGHWSYAQSVFIYLILIADLGLTVYGAREIARYRERLRFYMANIVALRTVSAVILTIALFITIHLMAISTELKILYAGGALIMLALAWDPVFLFQGLERMAGIALWRVMNYLLFFIAVLVFVASPSSLPVISWLRGLSYLLPALLLWLWSRGRTGIPHMRDAAPSDWSGILVVSLVIAVSTLIVNVYFTFDTLVLGWAKGPEQVAWYAAAYRIVGQFMGLALMLQLVFGPVISRYRDGGPDLEKTVNYLNLALLLLGSLIPAVIYLLADPLIVHLYGETYVQSVWVLKGLSLALMVFFIQTGFITVLLYGGRERRYFVCMAVGAFINLALNMVAIPRWGFQGAVATTLLSHLVILGMAFIFVRRMFGIRLLNAGKAAILVIFTILFTLLSQMFFGPLLACLAFVVVYLLFVCFLFKKTFFQLFGEIKIGF